MLSLLQQLTKTDDEVCIFVKGVWFTGQVIQVDKEVVLLHNCEGTNDTYYTTALTIKSIDGLQFTTDFRPTKDGNLITKEDVKE